MSFLDFIEPHVWMTNSSEFYDKVHYDFARFDDTGYNNLALNGERIYRESKAHYDQCLIDEIERVAEWSRRNNKPLVTTECWAIVDYKGRPAAALGLDSRPEPPRRYDGRQTGCWAGMATSNFCGPQFVGHVARAHVASGNDGDHPQQPDALNKRRASPAVIYPARSQPPH